MKKIYLWPALLAVIYSASIIIILFTPDHSKIPVATPEVQLFPTEIPRSQISPEQAIKIVSELPEVIDEDRILLAKGTKTTLYVESQPTSSDTNFHIYYGEVQPDHEVRLVSFLVDSVYSNVSIDTLVDPQPVMYNLWSHSCQLESCKQYSYRFAILKKAYQQNNQNYLDVNFADFLTGDFQPDGYKISNISPSVSKLIIGDSTDIVLIDPSLKYSKVSFVDLSQRFNTPDSQISPNFWFKYNNQGKIIEIRQQFTP